MFSMTEARARFEERFQEFQNKARAHFADYKPEAKDEAVANSLFLTWYHFTALVENGKADDKLLTSAFWFSCRQTRSGRRLRTVRHDHSRELFDHAEKGSATIVRDIDPEDYLTRRTTILDKIAFKLDTKAWLDSLTENQRRRVLDLADGNSTRECALRWNVSRPAVSFYRRQLLRSFERFMIPKSEE